MVRPLDVAGRAGRAGEAGSGDTAPAETRPAAGGSQAELQGLLLIVGWLAQARLRAWLSRNAGRAAGQAG